jgi:capsular polysaccharide biosynthesis protein
MPDLLTVFIRQGKMVVFITLTALVLTTIILFMQPKEYAATLTALPTSSVNMDKARVFNANIQSLYSDLGSPDDLDRIVGTASLDTIYIAVAGIYNLPSYYGLNDQHLYAAARKLKKNCAITKTEYGQLKIKVWDKSPAVAVALANALFNQLHAIHRSLQNQSNALIAEKIKEDFQSFEQQYQQVSDSLTKASGANADILRVRKEAQLAQLQQYEKLLSEYSLMVKADPPVLMVVEAPQPAMRADRPKKWETLAFVLAASLLFSFLLSLFLETKQRRG